MKIATVEDQRSFTQEPERSVTPNMMVPRQSHAMKLKLGTSYSSGHNHLMSNRSATPARGRESRLIVVDGEDLSCFDDNASNAVEQNAEDDRTLELLERELTSKSLDERTSATAVRTEQRDSDNKHQQQQQPQLVSDSFDVASALRESVLMYDFEDMEAEIEQMEVKALP
jgi:hypothetical protein